jgi:hypothetical protein
MGKSYEAVYKRLAQMPDALRHLSRYESAVRSAGIISYHFELQRGDVPTVSPWFKVDCSGEELRVRGGDRHVDFDVDRFIPREALEAVVERYFGAPDGVPTYFCKKETILKGKDGKRDRQESFRSWFQDYARDRTKDSRDAASARILAQMSAMSQSEEFLPDQNKALVRFAVDEIRTVLKRYKTLGEDVLKQGVQEFIVEGVLDS